MPATVKKFWKTELCGSRLKKEQCGFDLKVGVRSVLKNNEIALKRKLFLGKILDYHGF